MNAPTKAHLSRHDCAPTPGTPPLSYWRLLLPIFGSAKDWPVREWSADRRRAVPTDEECAGVLAELGYQPAPGAEWEQPVSPAPRDRSVLLATIRIVPIHQPGRAT